MNSNHKPKTRSVSPSLLGLGSTPQPGKT